MPRSKKNDLYSFSALRRSRREHYRQNPAHQQPIRVSGDLSGRWKYLSEISFQAICQNIATCEFFTHATDVRRLAVFLPGFHILHRSGDSENNEQLEKTSNDLKWIDLTYLYSALICQKKPFMRQQWQAETRSMWQNDLQDHGNNNMTNNMTIMTTMTNDMTNNMTIMTHMTIIWQQ